MLKGRLCTLQGLSTHFSRPVVRDAILTRAPPSVHTHARPPLTYTGAGLRQLLLLLHILRSLDFGITKRINKNGPRSVRPVSLCFYCRLKNSWYDWKLSTTIWRRFAQGQMWSRGGTLHLEANSAGCRTVGVVRKEKQAVAIEPAFFSIFLLSI